MTTHDPLEYLRHIEERRRQTEQRRTEQQLEEQLELVTDVLDAFKRRSIGDDRPRVIH